jgi:hypothetical protein
MCPTGFYGRRRLPLRKVERFWKQMLIDDRTVVGSSEGEGI